ARSKLISMLAGGHQKVHLARREMDEIAAWIDLGVPFCGDYIEANAWSKAQKDKYQRYLAKRRDLARQEQDNICRLVESSSPKVVAGGRGGL
ncbi:MAG: hypothetical protein J7M21_05300, partial [Planctomycetes bacterium]|nr:hypothetical protein [Planctomycetota bacterium]